MNKFKHEKLYLQVILNDTDNTYHTTLTETKLEVAEYKHKIISKNTHTHICIFLTYMYFLRIFYSQIYLFSIIFILKYFSNIYIYSQLHRTETRKTIRKYQNAKKLALL